MTNDIGCVDEIEQVDYLSARALAAIDEALLMLLDLDRL